jgi:hypothetical protein
VIIKCGIYDEELSDTSFFICHHCGMPVCEKHGWVVASDEAFAATIDIPTAFAEPAAAQTVATARGLQQTAVSALKQAKSMMQSVLTEPQPAMHCRDCVEKYHDKGVDKRHGWKETLPTTFSARG